MVMNAPCSAQTTKDSANESATPKKRSGKQAKAAVKADAKSAETKTYASYRDAISSGYELKNAGKLEASRDAYEASLTFESTDREKCDA